MEEQAINEVLKSFGFKENAYGGMQGVFRGISFTICVHPFKGLCFMGHSRGERSMSQFEEYMKLDDITEQSLAEKLVLIWLNHGEQ